jgi:hypothetical protein
MFPPLDFHWLQPLHFMAPGEAGATVPIDLTDVFRRTILELFFPVSDGLAKRYKHVFPRGPLLYWVSAKKMSSVRRAVSLDQPSIVRCRKPSSESLS